MQPVHGTRRTRCVALVRIACWGTDTDTDTDPDADADADAYMDTDTDTDTDTDASRTCWTPNAEHERSESGIGMATARVASSEPSKAARPSVLPGHPLDGAPRRHAMQSTAL